MVTLAEVAKAAGVSMMTVSNALNGKSTVAAKTRERVLRIADDLGYRANARAQSLRSGRTGAIGLAIPELDMPFPAHFAAEVTSAAARRGLGVIVQQTGSDPEIERAIIHGVPTSLVDGVIVSALGADIRTLEKELKHRRVVLFDESITETSLDIVCSPNREGAAAACRHLVERGCRRIGVVGTNDDPVPPGALAPTSASRFLGALEELRDNHPDVEVIGIRATWTPLDARRAVVEAIDAGVEFDGLFCLTDSMALGALRGLADRGLRCPEDVKIVGFDGIAEGSYSVPTLSTIDLGVTSLAESAVDMLVDRIEHPDSDRAGRRMVAHFTLVARESSR